jgi:preprotein translocase subunit SecG
MNRIGQLPTWLVFVLSNGVTILVTIVGNVILQSRMPDASSNFDAAMMQDLFTNIRNYMNVAIAIGWISFIFILLWLHYIASTASEITPKNLRKSVIPVWIYGITLLLIMPVLMSYVSDFLDDVLAIIMELEHNTASVNPEVVFSSLVKSVVIIMLIALMYLAVSILMFGRVAKMYAAASLKRKPEFKDYFGETMLLYFSFIGVWIIHPGIRKLKEKDENATLDEEADSNLSFE